MMTENQLQELAGKHSYSFDDLKTAHDSLPPEKQNELDILETYTLSMHETELVRQAQNDEWDKLQHDYN